MEQRTTYHRYQQLHQEQELGGAESRPSLGFPLGTALLLIVIFSLSGIFSCCYHWDRLRSLRRYRRDLPAESDSPSPTKPTPPGMMTGKQEMKPESVTVIMPGDEIAKFIALPCPCQPPRPCHPPPHQLLHNYPPKHPTPTPFPVPMYL